MKKWIKYTRYFIFYCIKGIGGKFINLNFQRSRVHLWRSHALLSSKTEHVRANSTNKNCLCTLGLMLELFSLLQSGCCKPPTVCGYNYVNPTLWINPVNQMAGPDCYLWSNDQTQLCYNCNSCKAGLLGNLREEWRRANVFLIVAVVILISVYTIGCSAFKNAETEDLFRRYKQGWV